jgi:hypothetical protein
MKTTLIVLAFMAGSLTAAPLPNAGKSQETHRPTYADSVSGSISDVALRHVRRDVLDANVAMMKRGDDADDAYHTITPHSKRGDDADDAYHTITPHDKRGDDADDAYHTITPHKKRGDDADDAYHTITPHDKRGDDADDAYHTITPHEKAE